MDKKDQDLTDDHGGDIVLNESGTSVSIENTESKAVKQKEDVKNDVAKPADEPR